MTTDLAQEVVWLRSLSAASRARFLAVLSHNLTIGVRVLCFEAAGSSEGVEPIRVLNEAHHRVSSYLSHYLAGDEDPGWLHVVVDYVLNPSNSAAHVHAVQAWAHAKNLVTEKNAP